MNKCIAAYDDMKHEMGETLGFKEKLFLKLNMFSLLKRKPKNSNADIES